MQMCKASITPLSAFGTRPLGDTFFGQLCWALRNRLGEERLHALLEGYTQGEPFAVLSDAFPGTYLPRATLPGHWFAAVAGTDRKAAKKRIWLPVDKLLEPVAQWLGHCVPASAVKGAASRELPHPHNTIDRRSGTTGEGFAPYSMTRYWYGEAVQLDIYVLLDLDRLSLDEIRLALGDIGQLGFGRDAGIGLGRFELSSLDETEFPTQEAANAWLTLAPSAPQSGVWDAGRCFYTMFTRFGRHGDIGVRLGNPFKAPILLAATSAVLTPVAFEPRMFVGCGLGSDGSLSRALPRTVHQAYAPVIGIRLPEIAEAA